MARNGKERLSRKGGAWTGSVRRGKERTGLARLSWNGRDGIGTVRRGMQRFGAVRKGKVIEEQKERLYNMFIVRIVYSKG